MCVVPTGAVHVIPLVLTLNPEVNLRAEDDHYQVGFERRF